MLTINDLHQNEELSASRMGKLHGGAGCISVLGFAQAADRGDLNNPYTMIEAASAVDFEWSKLGHNDDTDD